MNTRREDLAWAAGLFEGEGCFGLYTQKKRGGQARSVPAVHAALGSTDEDVLRRFAGVVGVGHINGPYASGPGGVNKPIWQWQSGKFEHVQAVIVLLWPWLGARRRARARECLVARDVV